MTAPQAPSRSVRPDRAWLRHMLLYAAPGAFAKGLHLLLLPAYVSLLSVEDFGRLELLIVSLLCVHNVLDLGWGHAFLRLHHADVRLEDLVRTLLSLRVGVYALLAGAVALVGAERVATGIARAPDLSGAVWCLVALFCLRDWIRFAELRLRAQQRSGAYAALQLAHAVTQLACVVVFLIVLELGVFGILLGQSVAALVTAGVAAALERGWLVRAWGAGHFDRALARRSLAFGLPIAPALCVAWIISGSDRYMLSWILGGAGLAEVAQYGFAARVASALMLIVSGFTLFFTTEVFRTHRDPAAPARMAVLFRFYVLALFVLSCALVATVPILVRTWFRQFEASLVFLPLMLAAWIVHYVGGDFSIGLEIGERTGRRGLAGFAAVCVNVVANLVLIPAWGGLGACAGSLLGYATLVAVQLPMSQRLYPVDYPWMLWIGAALWVASASGVLAWAPAYAWIHATVGLALLGGWAFLDGSRASASPPHDRSRASASPRA